MPAPPERFAIPWSTKKLTGLVVMSAMLVVVGVLMSVVVADAPTVVRGLGVLCIAFFGTCGAYAVAKLFDRSPAVILDREGIIDNSSAGAVGRIRWDEISDLRVSTIGTQRFLTIDVVDVRRFAGRGGVVRRLLNAGNVRLVGSAINIPTLTLAVSMDELFRQVEIFYAAYGRRRG